MKVTTELGFEKPSDIQEQAIPHLMDGQRDFIGLAQTGTGKTAAFGLPLLERIDPANNNTQALILAPTRELGRQIAEQLTIFSKYMDKVNVLPVYGGANISTQIKALKKPQQVLIATPGRLIDLINRKAVKLDQLQYLILDEADEMLNMGFKEDIDKILSYTPDHKSTWLFSATMPKEIRRIVNKYMEDPIEVKVNAQEEVNANIEHQFAVVKQSNKAEALMRFLDLEPDMRGLVFCRTRRDTKNLAETLFKRKYKADALHGDLSQIQRDKVMKRFKNNSLQVLVATDVAARGIDVNDLTHVFHFALPEDIPYYTHRSGRTARAGKKGKSIAFINGKEKGRINRIKKELDISFEKVMIPGSNEVADNRIEEWCQKIVKKKTDGKLDQHLIDKAQEVFKDLSKEELTEKLLMAEMEKIDGGGNGDLNESLDSNSRDHKPFKGKGKGGGRKDFHKKRGKRPRKNKFSNQKKF